MKLFLKNRKISPTFVPQIAGWSSWQLVGLITQRSQVRVLSPLPRKIARGIWLFSFYSGVFGLRPFF